MLSLCALTAICGSGRAAAPVSDLNAAARDGQVFLTWKEAETLVGTTFNVYVSDSPVVDVTKANRVGHHIEPHSARDWWEDPSSFAKETPGKPTGFLIEAGGQRLDPAGGLFVYTVRKETKGSLFFAVTCADIAGHEDTTLVAGVNSLVNGVRAKPGDLKPIWQRPGSMPRQGAGRDKALWLELHAKGGVVSDMEYLLFGDETMGWREGLPFKFSVRVQNDAVVVRPTDRVWINRPHEDGNGGCAIWTFWFGYNSNIYDRKQMAEGIPTNYTERRDLWILDWVRRYYKPDLNRWSCSGSSMGGCGTVSFALHHPEMFAALHAEVPIVSYTYLGKIGYPAAKRLEQSCWIGPITPQLKTNEGVSLLDRLNGSQFVREAKGDLPFLFLINGRKDGSIPWENNPPFYKALADARQGFAAFWDDGTHETCGRDAPDDVKAWTRRFRKFRLDQSFPAFTNTSSNRNPGNGQPDNGDTIGWINRGMDWKDIEDELERYSITILADYPGIQYPVRTDMTLRRVQNFRTGPGQKLSVRIAGAQPISVEADANGRITIPDVAIPSKEGVRVVIQRAAGTQRHAARSAPVPVTPFNEEDHERPL